MLPCKVWLLFVASLAWSSNMAKANLEPQDEENEIDQDQPLYTVSNWLDYDIQPMPSYDEEPTIEELTTMQPTPDSTTNSSIWKSFLLGFLNSAKRLLNDRIKDRAALRFARYLYRAGKKLGSRSNGKSEWRPNQLHEKKY